MIKIRAFYLIAAILLIGITGTLQAEDWEIHLTVDNQYDVYFGTPLTTNYFAGGDTLWTTEESYTATGRLSTDYLYVATASDHFAAQGFIGTFINTTTGNSISTGDTVWEVFPAGAYAATNPYGAGAWPSSLMPTQAEVDTAIAYAETNGLWVSPTAVPGYDNNVAGTPIAPYTWEWGWTFPNVESTASWIWYDSGTDPDTGTAYPYRAKPFNGYNHDEFLVFRIAGAAVPEPATLGFLLIGSLALKRKK